MSGGGKKVFDFSEVLNHGGGHVGSFDPYDDAVGGDGCAWFFASAVFVAEGHVGGKFVDDPLSALGDVPCGEVTRAFDEEFVNSAVVIFVVGEDDDDVFAVFGFGEVEDSVVDFPSFISHGF